MNDFIKTNDEISKMRVAGKLASDVLMMIKDYVKPGITTGELDAICHNYIVDVQDAIPAPLNYKGFPKSICTSVNHQICHGIPSDTKKLKDGDIINIDVTVIKNGYHGDTSRMFLVGNASIQSKRLLGEMRVFVWKNGKPQAQDRYNDDLLMSCATALYVRDTALKLRQQGLDLARAQLSSFTNLNARNNAVIQTVGIPKDNPYIIKTNTGDEDLSWLL